MPPSLIILTDGHCGLCRRTTRLLQSLDWLHRLRVVDFRNEAERTAYAARIPLRTLEHSMHVVLLDGSTRTGFSAFRQISHSLPALWIAVPLLHLPGMAYVGEKVYAAIAASRSVGCADGSCTVRSSE